AMAQVYVHHTVSLSEALRIWGIGISISLIFLSLIYVGYFLLGRRWGTVFFIGVTVLIAAVYGASTVLVGVEAVFSLSPVLIVCLLAAGAVMLALSRFASVMIYKWKIS
ncbi:MAG TPA: ABC-2 transporter permease, partial [Candidatus Mediterraneibacter tabaqchaliae]|nr:ABC-2 transporter permease [Candidatus Mediterraneibacter tabaqchaliae]